MTMQVQMQKRPRWFPLFLLLLLAARCGSDGKSPIVPPEPLSTQNVLRLADADGAAGTPDTLVLSLNNVTDLSALQFDLSFDPAILTVTGTLATARSAGLETFLNTGSGTARIILVDLQGVASIATGDGSVVTVTVDVDAGAAAGASPILVENASGVDITATTLSVGGSSATYTVH